MKVCIIGKFPPIQGGVSAQTYWSAHALARRGHDVHVVTNAKEAVAPYRMHMRAEDWDRCEAVYGGGSVTVHWTDPVDRSQAHIPLNSPVVTKLATLAARAHTARALDVIFSHYLEPYGIAGHLVAQMTGVPHVVRLAGSDAGRLWQHPQFELLYDHVLRSAEVVVAAGVVAKRAVERGSRPIASPPAVASRCRKTYLRPGGRISISRRCAPWRRLIRSSPILYGAASWVAAHTSEFTASSANARGRSRCSRPCIG
jgi:glycosyltransferase involved in cell wall biosynthesis